jgi:serine/threonine protein kinase
LVNEAAHALSSAPDLDVEPEVTTFQKNEVVGQRYLILRFIAKGGMGEVYAAYDRTLKERVALKTVASSVSQNSRAVRRLKVEAQLARRVSHPNVCRIYDVGTHVVETTGVVIHFLTMELVEGVSLGEKLRSTGAIPVPEAEKIARQLLLGLSAAHRAGILHRDFKSDNVMLRSEPEGGLSAVIMDFGLARALGRDTAQLTTGRNQGLVGTIAFMSPEQIENRPLTPASDIYSFGVAWFEMLTGKLPFLASTSAGTALERFRRSAVAPSSINPRVSKTLDPLVLRCLSRQPQDRFNAAEDVLEALDRQHDRETLSSRVRKRLRGAWVAAAVCILGVVSYGAISVFLGRAEDRHVTRNEPEAPFEAVSENAPPVGVPAEPPRSESAASSSPDADEGKAFPEPAKVKRSTLQGRVPGASRRDEGPVLPATSVRKVEPLPPDGTETGKTGAPNSDERPAPSATPLRRAKPDWEDPFRSPPPSSSAP